MRGYYYLEDSDPFYIGPPHRTYVRRPKRDMYYLTLKREYLKMARNWEKIKDQYLW